MKRFSAILLACLVCMSLFACSAGTAAPSGARQSQAAATAATASPPPAGSGSAAATASTPTPEPSPTPVPVLTADFPDTQIPMSDDYKMLVYVVAGTLDGRDVTFFLTEGGLQSDGKSWYCVFNDAFTGKPLLERRSASSAEFDASKTNGAILPLAYLPGEFTSDNEILRLDAYLQKQLGYTDDQVAMLASTGEIATFGGLLDFYKANVPESAQYIAPRDEMRAIGGNTCMEAFIVDGQEKLLIVEHVAWKIQARTSLYSVDLITGRKLYDGNDPQNDLLKPQAPASLVPFQEYFKGVPYERALTKDALIAFYKANVPQDKQYFVPEETASGQTSPPAASPEPEEDSGLSRNMDVMNVRIDPETEDVLLNGIGVSVATGLLDGKSVILFVFPWWGFPYGYKDDAYCDAFSGLPLLVRSDGDGPVAYKAADYLQGTWECTGFTSLAGYFEDRRISVDWKGVKTGEDLRHLYEKYVAASSRYMTPEDLRVINGTVYVETFLVGGEEKLMIVSRTEHEYSGGYKECSSYDYLYGCNSMDPNVHPLYTEDSTNGRFLNPFGLVPKSPYQFVPFAKYFKNVKYPKVMTKDELIAFYKANIPEDKQYMLPENQ